LGVELANEEHDHEHDHEHEHHHHHEHQSIYLRDQRVDAEFRAMFLNRKVGENFTHTTASQAGDVEYRYIIESVRK